MLLLLPAYYLLQDGEFAVGKDPSKHKATAGAHVNNSRVESNFGCVDILMRMFRYATVENVSGVAQQVRLPPRAAATCPQFTPGTSFFPCCLSLFNYWLSTTGCLPLESATGCHVGVPLADAEPRL